MSWTPSPTPLSFSTACRSALPLRRTAFSAALLALGCFAEAAFAQPPAAPQAANGAAEKPPLKVSTEMEGASAKVLEIDQAGRRVRIAPGGDPKRGWTCWWYFKLEGLARGETVSVEVEGSDALLLQEGPNLNKPLPPEWAFPEAAAVSFDGVRWKRGPKGERVGPRMRYTLKAEGEAVWLAWGPPFTPRDAQSLVDRLGKLPFATKSSLSQSREGRPCPLLEVKEGPLPDAERFHVWVHARQHAWEAGSSWVAKGFAEWLCGPSPQAAEFRAKSKVLIVPIMDVDHVATGDGGKEGLPADHNRDWSEKPHWPEVAAARKELLKWAGEGRLDAFFDLHNPSYRDAKTLFYVNPEEILAPPAAANLESFLAAAQHTFQGRIPYEPQPRSTGPQYHPQWKHMSKAWAQIHGNPHTLSLTLETAWNAYESEDFEEVGASLGGALAEHLKRTPRELSSGKAEEDAPPGKSR